MVGDVTVQGLHVSAALIVYLMKFEFQLATGVGGGWVVGLVDGSVGERAGVCVCVCVCLCVWARVLACLCSCLLACLPCVFACLHHRAYAGASEQTCE